MACDGDGLGKRQDRETQTLQEDFVTFLSLPNPAHLAPQPPCTFLLPLALFRWKEKSVNQSIVKMIRALLHTMWAGSSPPSPSLLLSIICMPLPPHRHLPPQWPATHHTPKKICQDRGQEGQGQAWKKNAIWALFALFPTDTHAKQKQKLACLASFSAYVQAALHAAYCL